MRVRGGDQVLAVQAGLGLHLGLIDLQPAGGLLDQEAAQRGVVALSRAESPLWLEFAQQVPYSLLLESLPYLRVGLFGAGPGSTFPEDRFGRSSLCSG
jgi:hypothetical protein